MSRILLTVVILMVFLVGCSSDDPGEPITNSDPPLDTFPETATELVAHLQNACQDMDPDRYADLIHPDFQMVLQDQTKLIYPELGETLNRAMEIRIAARMFSGDPVTDPSGESIPAVFAVSIGRWHALDEWRAIRVGAPVPGTLWAPFEIDILLDRGQEDTTLNARGQVHLYATVIDSLADGTVGPFYQLSGMIDMTEGHYKAIERANLGTIKGMYR